MAADPSNQPVIQKTAQPVVSLALTCQSDNQTAPKSASMLNKPAMLTAKPRASSDTPADTTISRNKVLNCNLAAVQKLPPGCKIVRLKSAVVAPANRSSTTELSNIQATHTRPSVSQYIRGPATVAPTCRPTISSMRPPAPRVNNPRNVLPAQLRTNQPSFVAIRNPDTPSIIKLRPCTSQSIALLHANSKLQVHAKSVPNQSSSAQYRAPIFGAPIRLEALQTSSGRNKLIAKPAVQINPNSSQLQPATFQTTAVRIQVNY